MIGDDCVFYGFGYYYWVFGMGDGGVYQYCFVIQFYGDCCIGSGVYVGVYQYWDFGFFEDDVQVVGVVDVQVGVDQVGQWYYCDVVDFGQLVGDDWVVVGVYYYVEVVFYQLFGGFEGFDDVGEQGFLVGEDFQFDQVVFVQQFVGQVVGVYGFDCVIVVGGVWQDGVVIWWDYIQQVWFVGILFDVGVLYCYCDDFCFGGFDGLVGFVEVFVFVGFYQQV